MSMNATIIGSEHDGMVVQFQGTDLFMPRLRDLYTMLTCDSMPSLTVTYDTWHFVADRGPDGEYYYVEEHIARAQP